MNPEPDDQKDLNHLMLTQYRGGNRDDNKNYQGVPAEADADRGLKIGFSKFAGVIFDAVVAVIATVTTAITALQTALVTILTTIATNISSAATTVSTAISNLSSALVTAINNFSTAMTTAIGLVSTALGTINTTIGGITTALAGVATIATESTAIRKQALVKLIAAGQFGNAGETDLNSTAASPWVALAAYDNCYIEIVNADSAAGSVTLIHGAAGNTIPAWHLGIDAGTGGEGFPIQAGERIRVDIGTIEASDRLNGKALTTNVRWALYGAAR